MSAGGAKHAVEGSRTRERGRASTRPTPNAPTARQAFVGVDLSNAPVQPAPRGIYPLVLLAVVAALGVAALRIDLLRTRYAVSAGMERENELREEQRQLIVRRRQLRDPVELAVQARERGFKPPAHVLSLPDPELGTLESIVVPHPVLPGSAVAAVSAGPSVVDDGAGSEWQ